MRCIEGWNYSEKPGSFMLSHLEKGSFQFNEQPFASGAEKALYADNNDPKQCASITTCDGWKEKFSSFSAYTESKVHEILQKSPPHKNILRLTHLIHSGKPAVWVLKHLSPNSPGASSLLKEVDMEDLFKCMHSPDVRKIQIAVQPRFSLDLLEAAENGLSKRRMISATRQALNAVTYLHEQGIVHGDIKPENYLVNRKKGDIHVVLCDFGTALYPEAPPELYSRPCGTPMYLNPQKLYRSVQKAPPELSKEEYVRLQERGDLWALAMTIHMIFTKQDPDLAHPDPDRQKWMQITKLERLYGEEGPYTWNRLPVDLPESSLITNLIQEGSRKNGVSEPLGNTIKRIRENYISLPRVPFTISEGEIFFTPPGSPPTVSEGEYFFTPVDRDRNK